MFIVEGVVMYASPFTKIITQKGIEIEKQTIVIEYEEGDYKNRISLENPKTAPFTFKMGDVVTVAFSIDSAEYNGRWYNRVKCTGMVMRTSSWKKFPLNPDGPYKREEQEDGYPRRPVQQQRGEVSADDLQY